MNFLGDLGSHCVHRNPSSFSKCVPLEENDDVQGSIAYSLAVLIMDFCLNEYMHNCKENGPLAHLVWILVFDDQHNQIGLTYLLVIIL